MTLCILVSWARGRAGTAGQPLVFDATAHPSTPLTLLSFMATLRPRNPQNRHQTRSRYIIENKGSELRIFVVAEPI